MIGTKVKTHKSRNVRKRTFGHMRPAKIQINLRIRAVWSDFTEHILDSQRGKI